MSFDWNVESNHNHVANYQISGIPYTGKIDFTDDQEDSLSLPRVSRWITLQAVGGDVTVYFKTGNNANGYILKSGETLNRLELRCSKIYAIGAASRELHVIAGLTTCNTNTFISESNLPV
mgnify:CR=1 FL=1